MFSPSVGPKDGTAHRARQLETVFGGDQEYYKAASPWFLAEKNAAALRDTVSIRQMLGEQDFTLPANRDFDAHLTRLNIPHTFHVAPGVDHSCLPLFKDLGEENWKFYLGEFSSKKGS